MAALDNSDPIDELPEAQSNSVARLLNAFHGDNDLDRDNLSSQDYIGLHNRLEDASGVDRWRGAKHCTLTPAQRATWSQQLRSASVNANKQVLSIRLATELSQKLDDGEQRLSAIHSEASAKDIRLQQSLKYFQGKKPKEIRQAGVKMMMANLLRNPELLVDLMQELSPVQSLAQKNIDSALAFAKDRDTFAQEREKAAETLQKQIQKNITTLKEAEFIIEHLASGFSSLQRQQDSIEQSCKTEVDEATRAQAEASGNLERAQAELRDTRASVHSLQKEVDTSKCELQQAKIDLREAQAQFKAVEKKYFNESVTVHLLRQEKNLFKGEVDQQQSAINEETKRSTGLQIQVDALKEEKAQVSLELEEALRSKQELEKKLQSKVLQSEQDAMNLSQLRDDVKTQRRLAERGAEELNKIKEDFAISQSNIADLVGRIGGLRTRLTTVEGECEELQSNVLETGNERDELQTRLSILTDWHNQTIVYGEIWKLTMDQTGNYNAEIYRDIGASLNAVETFRLNLHPKAIRSEALPVSRIHGIDEVHAKPAMKAAILSLFGRVHTKPCMIPLNIIQAICQMLGTSNLRSRRLNLLFLYAFLRKRCSLIQESSEPCSLATSLVILRCIELLQCHLSGRPLLDLVMETFNGVKEKLMVNSALVQAMMDRLTSGDRSLAQCLLSMREFLTVPQSNCKVCMDHGMLIVTRGDQEVAYIQPSFFRLRSDFVLGWSLVFDGAPMLGSWTTPHWGVGAHLQAVHRIFESAFVMSNSSADPIGTRPDEDGLVDVVAV